MVMFVTLHANDPTSNLQSFTFLFFYLQLPLGEPWAELK